MTTDPSTATNAPPVQPGCGPRSLDEAKQLILELQARQAELEAGTLELNQQLKSSNKECLRLREEQETAKMFISAIDQSLESIFFTDIQGHILYVNHSFERNSGYTQTELLGKTPRILKSGIHPRAFYKDMWDKLLGGEAYHSRMINKRKDGSHFHEEVRIAPVFDAAGNISRFVSVNTDVTRFIETQKALEESNRELSRSNAELEQFAYVASHDLQEPLRSVTSCLQLLERRYAGQLDGKADEFISHAVTASKHMHNLIDDLLEISRINRENEKMETTACAAVLATACSNLAKAIEESGALLTHDELPVITADSRMLTRLFQNLISNALKFSGGSPPVIHVGAEVRDNEVAFSIRDHGIGIEEKYFERIFRLFQRLHTHEEHAGTGLGLSICQKIVDHHHGRIWVESTPGQGSTFHFILPKTTRE